ncbi:MAG: BolA family transcriptional regulator [Rhodocyclaceae bacterium]|nr:BolA family transcriptional regulator [Rhodocyclaceae bacterium]
MNVPAMMEARLASLAPSRVEILDDSARHRGHAGAREGGHFRLAITSAAFEGLPTLARHRMVHAALGDLMRNGIHALSISAATPSEFQS